MDYVDVPLRVRYAATDMMGVVYYGNYPIYFEVGRSEYMREKGFCYREFEGMGYRLVVAGMEVRYYNPATYDDLIKVRTSVSDVQSRGLTFNYEIMKDDTTLVRGKTRHICVSADRKPTRIPDFLVKILKNDGSP
jgi:acyl-CoA thioester hydrolase